MRFLGARGEEELTLFTMALNNGKGHVNDVTTRHWQIRHGLSAATMLRKAVAAIRATRAAAPVEFKVHLRPHLLAANLVDDIPVEIV